jgi:dTDP-4-dehydrorhamnose reductase
MITQRVVILGAGGLLGSRLMHYLADQPGVELIPLTHAQADVTKADELKALMEDLKPHWVINATAFLNPDNCEKDPDKSYAVNYQGALNAAEATGMAGGILIQFSTDYVFDGKTGGYAEEDETHPLSNYGMHKHMVDEVLIRLQAPAYIFRIASLIGAGEGKNDIVKALLGRLAGGAKKLEVVNDMEISISTPQFIAQVISAFIKEPPRFGEYHVVAQGKTTWFDACRAAFMELDIDVPFVPITADAFPRLAARPMKSWLKTDKLASVIGSVPLWQDVLADQVYDLRDEYLPIVKRDVAAA